MSRARPSRRPRFGQLRTWAEFWADSVATGHVVCCQLADDELVASEPEQYDCRSCVLIEHLTSLDADNQQAWEIYRACCNRFTQDLGAGSVVLDRLTQDMEPEDFVDVTDRLRLVYDILAPRKEPTR